MGRASNRKKARRLGARHPDQGLQARAAPQAALLRPAARQTPSHQTAMQGRQQDLTWRDGSGGREPVPAVVPRWPQGSLGERFCSDWYLARASGAPNLITAKVPDAAVIRGDPEQWSIAADVLVRAVVYDGARADHPIVNALADVLGPVAEAELAYAEAMEDWCFYGDIDEEDEPEFPYEHGPLFLIGTCAVEVATEAVIGQDPLARVHAALAGPMDGVIAGLPGYDLADALIGAVAVTYRRGRRGDPDAFRRVVGSTGDVLGDLIAAGAVPPRDIVRAGVAILAVLAELGMSSSPSILRPAA
jgi:hypothetical protein